MQPLNPYTTPAASLQPIEQAAPRNADEVALRVTTLWRRVCATLLDSLIFLPVLGLSYLLSSYTRMFCLYLFVPNLALVIFYQIYLVKRYGGTPGKRLMHMRIVALDGTPISTRQAILRHLVLFILSTATSVGLIIASFALSDAAYFSQGYVAKTLALTALAPAWYSTLNIATQIWVWGQAVVILCNKQRRALHDYIAGTVVIRTDQVD